MRSILVTLLILSSTSAFATKTKDRKLKKICAALIQKAEANCTDELCASFENEGEDCPQEDFQEALQSCMDGEIQKVVDTYNKKFKTKLSCEE